MVKRKYTAQQRLRMERAAAARRSRAARRRWINRTVALQSRRYRRQQRRGTRIYRRLPRDLQDMILRYLR